MNILAVSSIYADTIEKLRQDHDVICAFNANEDILKSKVVDREVIIFRSGVNVSVAVMSCAPNLKLLIRAGSGVDNIDLEYVSRKKIKFHNIPEPAAKAVTEMSFGMMIGLARKIYQADRLLRQGIWAKREMDGYLLTEKILGIVGTGNIGSRVGMLGAVWGMEVIGCVRSYSLPGRSEELAKKQIRLTDFDEVISMADFISIHVPLTKSTRNMFNEDVFSRIKKGSFLINLARGGVVNEIALYKALTEKQRLLGAALDVHENEGEGKISLLAELPNVILTPHIGAQTFESQREIGEKVVEILNSYNEKHV